MADEMVFEDLEPVEVPVSIRGRKYLLREADGAAAVKYRNANTRGARMDKDAKIVTLGEIAEAEPVLVAACLCPLDGTGKVRYDPAGNPVTATVQLVLTFRAATIRELFRKVKEISPGLDETDKAEANGHGPDPTSAGSPGATPATSPSPPS